MNMTRHGLKPDLTRICPIREKRKWLAPQLGRLEIFVKTPEFQTLPEDEQSILKRELVVSRELLEILDTRIAMGVDTL